VPNVARRPPPALGDVAGLPWERVRLPVKEFLDWCRNNYSGIPGGFKGLTPTRIMASVAAFAGTMLTSWAAADHVHDVETASAVGLAGANTEGTGTALARASHTHKREIEVRWNGATVGIRRKLHFLGGTVADDAGEDEIEVTLAADATQDWAPSLMLIGSGE
jgi:hypothetical protein